MVWIYAGVSLGLIALAARAFSSYRIAAAAFTKAERVARREAHQLGQQTEMLRAEAAALAAATAELATEKATLTRDLDAGRQNYEVLYKRHLLRHVGRQRLDRDGAD